METSPLPEDSKWQPLKKCLGEESLKEFSLAGTIVYEGRTIFQYKHIHTHETIHIDQDGRTYQPIFRPESPETDTFQRITKAEAKERAFGQIPRLRE